MSLDKPNQWPLCYDTWDKPWHFLPPVSVVKVIELVLCVIQHSHSQTVWCGYLKIGRQIDLDKIWVKLEGQGHRSRVKVKRLKNVISMVFWLEWPQMKSPSIRWFHHAIWHHGHYDVIMSWDVMDISRAKGLWNVQLRGAWMLRHFHSTYLRPASISTAALKFPRFQQVVASRKIHDKTAFLSSWVGWVMMICVTHELTY